MGRVVWIAAFFGIIACGSGGTIESSFHLRRMLNTKENSKSERQLCRTRECEELAQMFANSMNRTVDPCEDFYEYVCGNWAKNNPIPKDEEIWNILHQTAKSVDVRLKEIIDEKSKPEDLRSTKLARRVFRACMDTDKMDKEGLEPLISTMWRAGGWPLIMEEDEWDSNMYTWQKIDDYYAYLMGLNSFHDLSVDLNYNTGKLSLALSTPHIPYRMYRLVTSDEIEMDSSDENNDSGEGSQEPGSEEREDYEGSGENSDYDYWPGTDDEDGSGSGDGYEDDEDEYKLQRWKKINNRVIHSEKKMNNRNKEIKKNVHGGKLKKRMERDVTRTRKHIKKHNKRRNTRNRNMDDTMKRMIKELSKSKSQYKSHNKFAKMNNLRSNKRNGNEDKDVYFYRAKAKDNESGKTSEYEIENDEDNDSDNDDEDSYEDYYYDYRGSDSNESVDSTEEREKRIKEAEEQRERYAEYMLNVSLALSKARGVSIPEEKLKEDIDDLVEFQVNLVKCIRSSGKQKNITIESFQEKYDSFEPQTNDGNVNWVRKMEDAFTNGGMDIDSDEYVLVTLYTYFKKLRLLLDTTPSRTIVNYVHWNMLSRMIEYTTKEMRKFDDAWTENEETDSQRMMYCIEETKIKHILGYEYVKRYFTNEALEKASDMVDDIQKEVENDIEKSPWMDDDIRELILDKLVYMKKVIGYSDVYKNTTVMKEYLKGLSVTDSHFENMLSIKRYFKIKTLKTIFAESHDFLEYSAMDPLMVNAFFSPMENAIEITAADFQAPFYSSKQPWYTNYGMIGYIMSHEVNHAFDTFGRRVDRAGSRVNWPRKMKNEYKKRAQCIIDQFTNYSVVENKTGNIQIKNYGRQTSGENIADIMGLQASFKAYQRRMRECDKPDPMLPGLEDLSNEQLFFLSFGYTWCEVYADPETFQKYVQMDSHSHGLLRIIGSVSNSEEFANAYNCPLGSPMNPKKKCNIWK